MHGNTIISKASPSGKCHFDFLSFASSGQPRHSARKPQMIELPDFLKILKFGDSLKCYEHAWENTDFKGSPKGAREGGSHGPELQQLKCYRNAQKTMQHAKRTNCLKMIIRITWRSQMWSDAPSSPIVMMKTSGTKFRATSPTDHSRSTTGPQIWNLWSCDLRCSMHEAYNRATIPKALNGSWY